MATAARKERRQKELIHRARTAIPQIGSLESQVERLREDLEGMTKTRDLLKEELRAVYSGNVDLESKVMALKKKHEAELSELHDRHRAEMDAFSGRLTRATTAREEETRQLTERIDLLVADQLRLKKQLKESEMLNASLRAELAEIDGQTVKGMQRRLYAKQKRLEEVQLKLSELRRRISSDLG